MTIGLVSPDPDRLAPETAEALAHRGRHEAAIIARAEVDIDAGRGIDDERMESWLDALDRDDSPVVPVALNRGV
jgi:hypothetical protein